MIRFDCLLCVLGLRFSTLGVCYSLFLVYCLWFRLVCVDRYLLFCCCFWLFIIDCLFGCSDLCDLLFMFRLLGLNVCCLGLLGYLDYSLCVAGFELVLLGC